MSADTDRPEPDRVEGAPHPRETRALIGQSKAEIIVQMNREGQVI